MSSWQAAKAKQRVLKRRAMGLDGIATDVIDSGELFSLAAIKGGDELDAIRDVRCLSYRLAVDTLMPPSWG
jgi:hypothetical protein